jgi:hypothetical protein
MLKNKLKKINSTIFDEPEKKAEELQAVRLQLSP